MAKIVVINGSYNNLCSFQLQHYFTIFYHAHISVLFALAAMGLAAYVLQLYRTAITSIYIKLTFIVCHYGNILSPKYEYYLYAIYVVVFKLL